jgi:DNA modification methylase
MSDAELAWTSFDKNVRVFDESRNADGYKEHPTQKPITVMSYCLENYSQKENWIIDPFVGSGTTAVACEQLGRRWIGIEINEKYAEIAAKRIKAEADQLKMF